MHVVHVACARTCTRKIGLYVRLMRLKICIIVVLGKDNILAKFRANPMHAVHVVRARMCIVHAGNFGLKFRAIRLKIKVRIDA